MIAAGRHAAVRTVLLVGVLAASIGPAVHAAAVPAFRGPLLLITVDALRADRLGAAGYRPAGRSLTPRLDALIDRGAHVRRVWATSPTPEHALGSILTSRYPSELRLAGPGATAPAASSAPKALFELLGARGYRTIGAASASRGLARLPFARGVSEWLSVHGNAPIIIERLRVLVMAEQRVAAWVHFHALHTGPGQCAPGERAATGRVATRAGYDRRLAAVDSCIGALLDALAAQGLADDAAVLVIGVHGANLGERRASSTASLFEEQLRVPLVVRVPGVPGVNVDVPASTLDVVPTLLELIGEQSPPRSRGRSLLPNIHKLGLATDKVRPVFAELLAAGSHRVRERMLMVDGHKLIHQRERNRYALYNVREDRDEQRELLHDPASRVALEALRARLARFEQQLR